MSERPEPLVGVQLGPQSVFDEGVEPCLDILAKKAAVNALFVYSQTYYPDKHRTGAALAPDHGIPVLDETARKLTKLWHPAREEFYGNTILRHRRDPGVEEYADRDVFAELIEPARKRGISVYARILEPIRPGLVDYLPDWGQVLSVDVFGDRYPYPCFNNPDYANWLAATGTDLFSSYPLAGFQWGVERVGPLPRLLFRGEKPVCFCEHCQAQAEAAGTRVDRAMAGYRDLYEYIQGVRSGRESKPRDGVLVGVLRRLIRYPEILAWERHWQEAREACAQGIFRAIKAVSPQAEVGWHIDHQQTTWDAIYRAGADYAVQGENCDFLKLCVYHDVAGPRVRRWYLDRVAESLFREISLEQSLGLFYAVMGLDPARQPTLAEMDERGFSTDYIEHEIGRCVEAVGDRCRVYGGIAFDVPFGAQGGEWTHFASDPEDVKAAVRAAMEAGASGVVASREYDEMRLPNLQAFGEAMREMGAG